MTELKECNVCVFPNELTCEACCKNPRCFVCHKPMLAGDIMPEERVCDECVTMTCNKLEVGDKLVGAQEPQNGAPQWAHVSVEVRCDKCGKLGAEHDATATTVFGVVIKVKHCNDCALELLRAEQVSGTS